LGLGIPGMILWSRALERRDAAAVALALVLVIAAGSGYAKAEVERIWLFLVPLAAVSIGPLLRQARPRPGLFGGGAPGAGVGGACGGGAFGRGGVVQEPFARWQRASPWLRRHAWAAGVRPSACPTRVRPSRAHGSTPPETESSPQRRVNACFPVPRSRRHR